MYTTLIVLCFAIIVAAQEIEPRGTAHADFLSIVSCLLLVPAGVAQNMFGFCTPVPTMLITGFNVGAYLTMLLMKAIHPLKPSSADLIRDMFLLTSILVGLVSAAVHLHYFRQAIYLAAVLFSLVAFHFIQTTFSLASPEILFLVATGTTIPAFYGLHFHERILIMATTAISGAVMILVGADAIANTGIVYNFRHGQEPGLWEALQWGAVAVIAIVGFVVQYHWTSRDLKVFGAEQRERSVGVGKSNKEKGKDGTAKPSTGNVQVPEKAVVKDSNAWV